MLIVNAEVGSVPAQSVRVERGRISAVGADLGRHEGEPILDAAGGAVIPGLHDHHVHLRSAVAARSSVPLDADTLARQGGLAAAMRAAVSRVAPGEWLRGVGATGSDAAALDRDALDTLISDRPVRVQHRTGELWTLNSAAIALLRVDGWPEDGVERRSDGTPTGRLWRLDARLREALGRRPDQGAALHRLSSDALRMGITGFTDATPGRTLADLIDLDAHVAAGRIRQRLTVMAGTDVRSPELTHLSLGAMKFVLDDPTLPTPDAFAADIGHAHSEGIPVAVHCVTADQLVVAAAALGLAGPLRGDRIEHAGIVPPGYAQLLADLGVTVVTQPGFVAERGDEYLREVAPEEQPWLYPCASLMAVGVAVAAGSDAPFGPLDPWPAMLTAASRRAASGALVGPHERIGPAAALGLYLGHADEPGRLRRVAAGEPAELCVLRRPLADVLRDLGTQQVAAVVIDDTVHTWPH